MSKFVVSAMYGRVLSWWSAKKSGRSKTKWRLWNPSGNRPTQPSNFLWHVNIKAPPACHYTSISSSVSNLLLHWAHQRLYSSTNCWLFFKSDSQVWIKYSFGKTFLTFCFSHFQASSGHYFAEKPLGSRIERHVSHRFAVRFRMVRF